MNPERDYKTINKKLWDDKTQVHYESEFYNNQAFIEGKQSLNDIELPLLGDLTGKKVLHLQCHFGQDTLSMARMGARVTGVDLSEKAIEKAHFLTKEIGQEARFICCDVLDLKNHLNDQFDVVFTSYGTIGWLPDVNQWAEIISHFLKPGGKLVFAEFHPVVWMFDYVFDKVSFGYFNSGAIVEELKGTYTDEEADLTGASISWNHPLSDVIDALLSNGLTLTHFSEYDYSPYNCFKHLVEDEPGKYRIKHLNRKIPMVYALTAEKALG